MAGQLQRMKLYAAAGIHAGKTKQEDKGNFETGRGARRLRYYRLGRTGLKVSAVSLGTMAFGLTLLEQERNFHIVEGLRPLAARRGWTLPQLALAWVLSNPVVTSAILGASRPEQVVESLRHIDERLSEQELQEIDSLTRQAGAQLLTK